MESVDVNIGQWLILCFTHIGQYNNDRTTRTRFFCLMQSDWSPRRLYILTMVCDDDIQIINLGKLQFGKKKKVFSCQNQNP